MVLDSLNNIKGYRYELWCIARTAATRLCVVHVDTPVETCREWNRPRGAGGYDETIFEDLASRWDCRPSGLAVHAVLAHTLCWHARTVRQAGQTARGCRPNAAAEKVDWAAAWAAKADWASGRPPCPPSLPSGRFERPDSRNRWDSPLVTLNPALGPAHVEGQLAAVVALVTQGRAVTEHGGQVSRELQPTCATSNPALTCERQVPSGVAARLLRRGLASGRARAVAARLFMGSAAPCLAPHPRHASSWACSHQPALRGG